MHPNQDIILNNIRGILFDVDGTLYHQTPLRVIMALLLISSNFYKPKELLRKLKVIIQFRKSQELMRSMGKVKQCYKSQIIHTAEAAGESPSYIEDVIEEWFEKRPLSFIHLCRKWGMEKTIASWYKKGFRLGVFSDYPVDGKLQALGISRFFAIRVSGNDPEVQGFKPKTNGFALAVRKMGLDPSEIIYVGDRAEVDGVGASNAGMKTAILKKIFKKRSNCEYLSFSSFHELAKIIEKNVT